MERINGLAIFLLALIIFWQGRGLSIGNLHAPGPGFFPALIAGVLVILSLVHLVRGGKREGEETPVTASSLFRMVIVFLALIGYFLFLEYLGFVIVSFLLMLFLFLWIGRQKWYAALPSAVACIGLAYLLFEVLLKSNLPRGAFGF